MARTSRVRSLRLAQTAPNTGTIRDLDAYGTTANNGTTVAFAALGATTYQFSPNAAGASSSIPAGPSSTATDKGWRDTVAENAAEPIQIAAGTWNLAVRVNKTAMTINASVDVQVTFIVYRVTSAGAHIAEIGRGTTGTLTLATVGASANGTASFSSGALQFNAGDKIQVEAYVENTVAGVVSAPAAAYTLALTVDDTSANGGSGISSMPTYDILYSRASADTFTTGNTIARGVTTGRFMTETVTTADLSSRAYMAVRSAAETTVVGDTLARIMAYLRAAAETIATQHTVQRAIADSRAVSESLTTTNTADRSQSTFRRSDAEILTTTDSPSRAYLAARTPTEALTTTSTPIRATVSARSSAEALTTVDSIFRAIIQGRFLAEYPSGVTLDWSPDFPVKKIEGYVRDAVGNVVTGATVKLFRQSDDKMVQQTTSSATGYYTFPRDLYDPYTYYVLAYLGTAPQTHGVSDRGSVPV